MDTKRIGKQITALRKEHGYTQDSLAEMLGISPQAVSKWENGHSLPETSLLPSLSKALDCSIDVLLNDSRLQILSAFYGDGIENVNIASRLGNLIQNSILEIEVNAFSTGSLIKNNRTKYLTIKYQNDDGIFYTYCETGKILRIDSNTKAINANSLPEQVEIIAASFGIENHSNDVMFRIEHFKPMNWNEYGANHTSFPSDPTNDETDYLTFVYLNKNGINMVTCAEGESIAYTDDRKDFYTKEKKNECFIHNVSELPPFGEGWDCSWAGALTAALQVMGIKTTYDEVMGVSGACYRLAFCSPSWDYSSVDGLVAYDYATPAYKAYGYSPKFADRINKKNRSAERAEIVNQIKHNMPVLGINLRVAHEWGVICGYKNNGTELLCRTKYDREVITSPEYERDNPFDYLYVDNWPFIITYFDGKAPQPSAKENLINSLKVFIDCVNAESGGYKMGYRAYETWQNDLLDETWYEMNSAEMIERRFSVNQFCTLALYDARKSAHNYLKNSVSLFDTEQSDTLRKISELFGEIFSYVKEIHKMLDSGEYLHDERAKAFWTTDKRIKQAEILNKICGLEKEAEKLALEFVLNN